MSDLCLNTQDINNVASLSDDPGTKGFDLEAGQSWIYPTNYPVRDYQYNIIQEALYKNTLVSLPTGLGKTFIAAVVMYNFYRWYPHGKVIFMAPTRPLVEQQIDACYNIMAIPQEVTAELTGVKKAQASRAEVWQTKRVFFITPQVLQNDLEKVLELGNKIKCVVFDEAHRAKGNYAYCEVIRKLLPRNKLFRVLGLSATPGNSVKDIGEVMQNLLISHLEFRNEESNDVKPYVFERSLETVVVPLGEKLQQVKEDYEQILERYARTLIKYKVVHGNFSSLTKGKIHIVKKEFQARNRGTGTPHYSEIMKTLNICITLYHGYEALIRCGLRIFLSYFEEHINNPLLTGNTALIQIMQDLREYLGPFPEVECLPDGTFVEFPSSTKFGHPKFYKLRNILLSHFSNCDPSSRVIVFFEYKETVKEAYAILCQCYPTIKPRVFVGQGAGVRQKDQIYTVRAFRQGNCNTLLATCIGEEGLDVGEVDLIVCFDTTNKSPIRLIQRMGRTGRKKEGRIIILVTEGREQQAVKDSLICKNNLGNVMTNSSHLEAAKYKDNPSMIPSYIKPRCQKIFITVKKPVLTKSSSLKDMFRSMSTESAKFIDDVDMEVKEIKERIKSMNELLLDKENPLSFNFEESQINFSKHLEKQRVFQASASGEIKQSKQTEIYVHLLQFADSKRFNIPVTQTFRRLNVATEFKNLKQGDIRSMFSKCNFDDAVEDPIIPVSQIYNFEKEKEFAQRFSDELFQEINDYLSIRTSEKDECPTCANLFECSKFYSESDNFIDLSSWIQPDLSILDSLTERDFVIFANSLRSESNKLYACLENNNDFFDDFRFTQFEQIKETEGGQKPDEKSFVYEPPKNFQKILNSFRICQDGDYQNEVKKDEAPKGYSEIVSSSRIHEVRKENTRNKDSNKSREETLSFFKLTCTADLFSEIRSESFDSDKTLIYSPNINSIVNGSPDMFEESPDLFEPCDKNEEFSSVIEQPQSPVLCSNEKREKMKVKKKLFSGNESVISQVSPKPNLWKLRPYEITHNTPKKATPEPIVETPCSLKEDLDISDICDLSCFGLGGENGKNKKSDKPPNKFNVIDLDIGDICDLSVFGIHETGKSTVNRDKSKEAMTKGDIPNDNICRNEAQVKNNTKKNLNVDDICDISNYFNASESKTHEVFKKETKLKAKSVVISNKSNDISDIEDFCDLSSFLGDEEGTNFAIDKRKLNKVEPVIKETQNKLQVDKCKKQLNTKVDKNEERKKDISCLMYKGVTERPKNSENNVDLEVIDLTDSPEKSTIEPAKKPLSQLSITQMLSLISKPEDLANKNPSQKENVTCSTPKQKKEVKKSILSLKKLPQLKQNNNSPKRTQIHKNSTPKSKTKFNIPLASNSDDEFEESTKSPIFRKPKSITTSSGVKKRKLRKPLVLKQKKPKKLFCDFIEEEAVLSEDDNVAVSEDEESDVDEFEASFVNDETQYFLNSTEVHAQYLKTTKSPSIRGRFKIPDRPRHNVTNIFSQQVNNEDDTYMNDSFVVSTQEVDSPKRHELSELEILERKLKKMKRKDKKRKSDETSAIKAKRRRILLVNDDSD